MVAMETSKAVLLSLTDSLTASVSAFPEDEHNLLPPVDSNSLLDVKNELLLAYLQNLILLVILRLRSVANDETDSGSLATEVVKRLHEQRIYLERGIRPLEGRLKYQVDKVLRAADDAARTTQLHEKNKRAPVNGVNGAVNDDVDAGTEDEDASSEGSLEDATFARPVLPTTSSASERVSDSRTKSVSLTAPYRPPRIAPTAMPTPASETTTRSRAPRSALLDEYITAELSSAPEAQPSIGSNSTILNQGRSSLSTRDRAREKERTQYEEDNFTRLPGETKAERRNRKKGQRGMERDVFGGEDWTGLGGLGEDVRKGVKRDRNAGGEGLLERREKKRRTREDLPRGDGREGSMGDALENRRRVLEGRMERKSRRPR